MDDREDLQPEPRNLVFLRRLVTVLTGTMILGVVTIVILLVIRLQPPSATSVPEGFRLPVGIDAEAVSFGPGWIVVVTSGERILVFDRASLEIVQDVPLRAE